MKNEHPSDLRQYLNVLGEQLDAPAADRDVVMQTVKLVAMAAADNSQPMPEDVFAPGVPDKIARLMLATACTTIVGMASAPQLQQKTPKIIIPNGRSP